MEGGPAGGNLLGSGQPGSREPAMEAPGTKSKVQWHTPNYPLPPAVSYLPMVANPVTNCYNSPFKLLIHQMDQYTD